MKKTFLRLGCGLDISKDQFHACVGGMDQIGAFIIRAQRKFDNNASGIGHFLDWLAHHRRKVDAAAELPFQLVMETTGVYHEAVLFAAHAAGLPVCLELARRVKKYRQTLGQNSKTDKLDASAICQLAVERHLRRWQPLSPKLYPLRTALRHRKSLVKTRTSLLNQRHAAEHSHTADKAVAASLSRLIKKLEQEIAKLETHIHALYQADPILLKRLGPIVESVNGLGLLTALTVVAETNGFAHITSRKQLASYAGYDIVEDSSGQHQGKTKISKQGSARIRREMYMAALSVIRMKQGPLYDLYVRVKQRNPKAYKVASVAVQRKLLLLIYTLFKKQERFDPQKYAQPKAPAQKTSSPELRPELHEIENPKVALPLEG